MERVGGSKKSKVGSKCVMRDSETMENTKGGKKTSKQGKGVVKVKPYVCNTR